MSLIPIWSFWLVVAIGAAIGEVVTVDLFLASVAAAALVVAIVSLAIPSVAVTVLLFCALSLLGIFVLRPMVKGALHLERAGEISGPVSQNHIVNRRAVVTRTVDVGGGQIRVGVSEFWSARAFDSSDILPVDTPVEIVVVDGITALVSPVIPASLELPEPVEKGT